MKKNTMTKVSNLIHGWAKTLLLCLLLPYLGVYAESWQGHSHYEYSGPWKWTESNCRTIQTTTGYKEICDATITGYTGSSTDITIPEKITMHVSVVGDITVTWDYEATVTGIGRGAFSGLNLISVTIPDTVVEIRGGGRQGFIIDNGTGVEFYGAFECCRNLTSVTIGNNVTNIGNYAFYNCFGLTSVTIGNSVTSIGSYAFYNCSGLTNVTIPNSVTSIGNDAFYNCSGLTSVTIPNSVTNIGDTAFSGCSSLRNVYLHDVANVKGIAVWCGIEFGNSQASPFYYAQNLYLNGELVTVLEIPEGVTGIGNYAFYNCDCLQSVSIPYGVVSIGRYAFNDCDNIQQVSIHDSVANFGERAFYDCDNITIAAVPQSVMSQGLSTVFYRSYQNLQSLRLGANVSAIGVNEFANCRALTSVTVADGNTSYVVLDDGCLYDMARNLILFCPRDKASVTIPNGVTTIGNYAFQYCTNLVSASMPETVQSIGSASFVGCAKLSGLTIPSSVQTLPTAAFNGCDVLWTEWYRALANLSVNGGGSSSGGNVEPVDPRYALAASPADRAIASVTVDRDCAIDQFVLTDGKVYDTVLRVVNTSASEVHLTLPAGYVYETFKGATPLTIPANSRNMLTITRTTGDTFLVTREELETVK